MPLAPRETLDRKISALHDDILMLGSMVEQAIANSVKALKQRDTVASRTIYAADQHINDKRMDIETRCLTVIATQQPVARDMRTLASILEVVTELERVGDYAKGIARINLMMHADGQPAIPELLDEIPQMAELAIDMLHRALSAFAGADVKLARSIPDKDDAVDALYNQVYRKLAGRMAQDPACIDQSNYLLWAAHNLERTADRVSNICERTVFIVTGELVEMDK